MSLSAANRSARELRHVRAVATDRSFLAPRRLVPSKFEIRITRRLERSAIAGWREPHLPGPKTDAEARYHRTLWQTSNTGVMFFNTSEPEPLYVSRSDDANPLSSFSRHGFYLDDANWPTVEHYFQGMKFTDADQRAAIRASASPAEARRLAERHARAVRGDWKDIRQTVMTRGIYIKCRSHPDAARALLMTGTQTIVESSMYDYYWGCGRDGRGHNVYGKVLMAVREKLKAERTQE